MSENSALTRKQLNTPKAAAIAGIAFSVLLIAILWLLRRSVPDDPLDSGAWIATESGTVVIALNLIPFAGVAFLWFIGVLRDRLGQQEDRFFATVFFGSSLPFLAMLFAAAAIAGAVVLLAANASESDQLITPYLPFRARHRLHHRKCLRGQNGVRIHDLDIDCRWWRHAQIEGGADLRIAFEGAPAETKARLQSWGLFSDVGKVDWGFGMPLSDPGQALR